MSNDICIVLDFCCLDYNVFIAFPKSGGRRKLLEVKKIQTLHDLPHKYRQPDDRFPSRLAGYPALLLLLFTFCFHFDLLVRLLITLDANSNSDNSKS